MRVLVCGAGAVGARAARHLLADEAVDTVLVADANRKRRTAVVAALGAPGDRGRRARRVGGRAGRRRLAAGPPGRPVRQRAVRAGRHVVSVADSVAAVKRLLDLDAEARERGVDRGAGRRVLAPACRACWPATPRPTSTSSRRSTWPSRAPAAPPAPASTTRALRTTGLDWRDHAWRRRSPGSGRELSFFPDPIGGADCYRASLPDGLLLVPAFPGVERVTARLAATRRDRFTASLPMLRRPHTEGRIGGLRVEVRGQRNGSSDTIVLGAVDRPAVAAGTVAGQVARWIAAGKVTTRGAPASRAWSSRCRSCGSWPAAGVRAAVFEGL